MKNNCFTGRVSLKTRFHQDPTNPSENPMPQKNKNNKPPNYRRKNYSNPFDFMIFKGKANPQLPPVINKHKKTISTSVFQSKDISISDKPATRSLKPVKSEFALPKIFRSQIIPNPIIKNENTLNLTSQALKNIATPCFNGSLQQFPEDKKHYINLMAAKSYRELKIPRHKHIVSQNINLSEISFGDACDNENIVPLH
ncbi:hypothetical protein SteCoe_26010 [Stentor coeruleus]|uniref:Uncharacterized protein n=1 Tax=Stentor coeruleus TaxID=5963 RepID=A0A1R2BDV5_9CILI|nr:hypothetical protein SteCoe_26010 [Stentor coeruleus]